MVPTHDHGDLIMVNYSNNHYGWLQPQTLTLTLIIDCNDDKIMIMSHSISPYQQTNYFYKLYIIITVHTIRNSSMHGRHY